MSNAPIPKPPANETISENPSPAKSKGPSVAKVIVLTLLAVFVVMPVLVGVAGAIGRKIRGAHDRPNEQPTATIPVAEPSSKTIPPKGTTEERIAETLAWSDRADRQVESKIGALRHDLDRAGEGPETVSEVMTIVRLIQDDNADGGLLLLENARRIRTHLYRRQILDIRDAQRAAGVPKLVLSDLYKERAAKRVASPGSGAAAGGQPVMPAQPATGSKGADASAGR